MDELRPVSLIFINIFYSINYSINYLQIYKHVSALDQSTYRNESSSPEF